MEEIATMRAMVSDGKTDREVADRVGRPVKGVAKVRGRLGLLRRQPMMRQQKKNLEIEVVAVPGRPVGWLKNAWFGGSAPLTIPTHQTWRTLATHRMATGVTQDE